MNLTNLVVRPRYLVFSLLTLVLVVVVAFAAFGPFGMTVPFGTNPAVHIDQPIDSTRLGKIPADDRDRIAREQPNAGSSDVECVGECGP